MKSLFICSLLQQLGTEAALAATSVELCLIPINQFSCYLFLCQWIQSFDSKEGQGDILKLQWYTSIVLEKEPSYAPSKKK